MSDQQKSPVEIYRQRELAWSMLTHLSAILIWVFPFGNIAGPLIVWMFKRSEFPAVNEHGKAALNFQISFTIYLILFAVLYSINFYDMFFRSDFDLQYFRYKIYYSIPVILGVIFYVSCIILACIKSAQGKSFYYPLSIRFIKSSKDHLQ